MSNAWSDQKKFITVEGRRLAYVEMGSGAPIVFQHGNPTSSYLWRNIMPALAAHGRCIALDLVGMGDSEPLPNPGPGTYTLATHQRFFDAALAALGVSSSVTFVIHDWGTALGFDWARRHPQAVAGICHMEGIVRPLTWEEWPESARGIFRALRSPAGEELVLEKNVFVGRILPKSILRELAPEEFAVYLAPFREPGERRRPTLDWPRQIPLDGTPPEVVTIVEAYGAFLATSPIPKLFVNAEPGMIMTGAQRELARAWPNTTEVTVQGLHFIQEDSPREIAAAIAAWLPGLAR
ncbi:MAG: haloalkane dehalogenase [Gammaproteobacteria bacterium]|nr:haloalkane dehalogenase [Gammaproteobacteria bacterium]